MFHLLAKLPVWLLLLISASGVIAGDYFAKYWSTNQRTIFAILSVAGYAVSALFYIPTLLREGLVVTSILWSILSILGFLAIGLLVFHETLAPIQWVGVAFGIICLVIFSIPD